MLVSAHVRRRPLTSIHAAEKGSMREKACKLKHQRQPFEASRGCVFSEIDRPFKNAGAKVVVIDILTGRRCERQLYIFGFHGLGRSRNELYTGLMSGRTSVSRRGEGKGVEGEIMRWSKVCSADCAQTVRVGNFLGQDSQARSIVIGGRKDAGDSNAERETSN